MNDVAEEITAESARPKREGCLTLPARCYTDVSLFTEEGSRIFKRAWQYVGLAEDLRRPGDVLSTTCGHIPILVIRNEDSELRGFVNVCRHRGSVIVPPGCENRKAIQCPYHAWTYDLNGQLRAAPGENREADFDRRDFSLPRVNVDTWGPFVFARPSAGEPLRETLGDLPNLVLETGVPLGRLRRRARREYEVAANWKVVVDNYLECYHCPTAHPSFCNLIDVRDYQVTEFPRFSIQRAPARKDGRPKPYESREGVEEGFYAYLWPNFSINIYPGPGNVSLNLFQPVSVDKTRLIFEYCFVDEVAETEVEKFSAFVDQVQSEDTVLCERVQAGLQSGMIDHGRLMLSQERAVAHFQNMVREAMTH